MVPVAHGNDMGGSIRFPASMCGLVGLKPSRARSTLGPDFGEYWAMTTHEHVLTRTVRDTAGVLDAIAGPGVGDPYTAPTPARPFLAEVGADPGRLRIGFRTMLSGAADDAHVDCVEAVRVACTLLEDLGHDVEPTTFDALDDPRFAEAIPVVFPVFIARELDRWSQKLGREIAPSELEPWNALQAEMGRATTASAYVEGIEKAQSYARGLAQWWTDRHDILITPTLGQPPFPLGHVGPDIDPFVALERLVGLTAFSMPFNVSGQPAISLPLHWNDDGLPIGVQLVAAYGREDLLLRLAGQLEAAQPWADRRPPVSMS
jgi:amidase